MFYLMKAIHGLKPWIEKDEVTLNGLYGIACLADKYSVRSKYFQSSIVNQFCLENCPLERAGPAHEKLMGQYLFVAVLLGLSNIFPELTRRAVVDVPIYFDGHPVLRLLADFINEKGISIQKPFL